VFGGSVSWVSAKGLGGNGDEEGNPCCEGGGKKTRNADAVLQYVLERRQRDGAVCGGPGDGKSDKGFSCTGDCNNPPTGGWCLLHEKVDGKYWVRISNPRPLQGGLFKGEIGGVSSKKGLRARITSGRDLKSGTREREGARAFTLREKLGRPEKAQRCDRNQKEKIWGGKVKGGGKGRKGAGASNSKTRLTALEKS